LNTTALFWVFFLAELAMIGALPFLAIAALVLIGLLF